MINFKLSRMGRKVRWARSSALALGPLLAAVACNVYDDSLTGSVATPLGGSGADAGTAGSGATAGSGSGGMPGAGSETGGSAGTAVGGKGGEVASGGGGTAGAGTGGSAGTTMGGNVGQAGDVSEDAELVDDMEDNDAAITQMGERNGYWYVGNDNTKNAVMTPPTGSFAMAKLDAGDRSKYAAGLKAENFTGWGSDIGFNFHELGGVKPYDASAYCGISYWAKAATALTLRFRVPDVDTHPDGKVCAVPGTDGTACFDHFGIAAQLTTTWKQFKTRFTDLIQVGTGYHPADKMLKVDQLFAVEWALPGGAAKTYEIWIDDVELMKCP